jgi:hypothetical protein
MPAANRRSLAIIYAISKGLTTAALTVDRVYRRLHPGLYVQKRLQCAYALSITETIMLRSHRRTYTRKDYEA